MSHPSDNAEHDGSLPSSELNPLINPLLGQHMGRWAEVYFTSPPERREQAVQDLLRELEAEAAANQGQPDITQSEVSSSSSQTASPRRAETTSSTEISSVEVSKTPELLCDACGQENPANRRFCGRCGAPLMGNAPSESKRSELFVPRLQTQSDVEQSAGVASLTREESDTDDADYWGRNKFLRHVDASKLISNYEPAPYRYRIYLGAGLALLMGFLVYTGWRQTVGGSATSRSSPRSTAAGIQPVPQSSLNPPQVQTLEPAANAENQVRAGQQSEKIRAAAPAQDRPPSAASMSAPPAQEPAPKAVFKDSAPEQSSPGRGVQENGAKELAMAQHYLNGAQGTARDGGEAAKWLWQSVRKENTAATLTLSDLYLKGDGVPKSCDQARVLLDAAARKGSTGAAERLRNLPAFGCE